VLDRHQRGLVCHAQALGEMRALFLGLQFGFDLRPRAMHQHQANAERREQVQIVHELREARALGHQLAAECDHEGAAAERVHVRRGLAKPAHEGFGVGRRAHAVPVSSRFAEF